jgi:hypothetical protein
MAASEANDSVRALHPRPEGTESSADNGPLPGMPNRAVTSDTIEDAFVAFILHCNPGVPRETDTTALREAFGSLPKSDGNTFSSFTLFELIRKYQAKEIKTWGELALKLGVAPPDQEKGQSAQKIQQYAVRLKVCKDLTALSDVLSSCVADNACRDGCTRCT